MIAMKPSAMNTCHGASGRIADVSASVPAATDTETVST